MVDPNFDDFFIRDGVPLSVSELQTLGSGLGRRDRRAAPAPSRSARTSEYTAGSTATNAAPAHSNSERPGTAPTSSPAPSSVRPAHGGGGAYTETGIVWEERDKDIWPMFPLFGSPDYFDAPPIWEG